MIETSSYVSLSLFFFCCSVISVAILFVSFFPRRLFSSALPLLLIIIGIIIVKLTAINESHGMNNVSPQRTRKQLIAIIIQSCTTKWYRWPHSCMSLASLERNYLPLTVIEPLLVRDVPEINTPFNPGTGPATSPRLGSRVSHVRRGRARDLRACALIS